MLKECSIIVYDPLLLDTRIDKTYTTSTTTAAATRPRPRTRIYSNFLSSPEEQQHEDDDDNYDDDEDPSSSSSSLCKVWEEVSRDTPYAGTRLVDDKEKNKRRRSGMTATTQRHPLLPQGLDDVRHRVFYLHPHTKYCQNIQREHRSNGVYIVVTAFGIEQRCFCRCDHTGCKDYRGVIAGQGNALSKLLFSKSVSKRMAPPTWGDKMRTMDSLLATIKKQRR
jgi:hypothetical protein